MYARVRLFINYYICGNNNDNKIIMKTLFNKNAYLTIANLPQWPQNPKANTRRQRYNTIIRRTIIRNKKRRTLQQLYKTK